MNSYCYGCEESDGCEISEWKNFISRYKDCEDQCQRDKKESCCDNLGISQKDCRVQSDIKLFVVKFLCQDFFCSLRKRYESIRNTGHYFWHQHHNCCHVYSKRKCIFWCVTCEEAYDCSKDSTDDDRFSKYTYLFLKGICCDADLTDSRNLVQNRIDHTGDHTHAGTTAVRNGQSVKSEIVLHQRCPQISHFVNDCCVYDYSEDSNSKVSCYCVSDGSCKSHVPDVPYIDVYGLCKLCEKHDHVYQDCHRNGDR